MRDLGLLVFDETHPELVQKLIQHLPLLGCQVAARLDLEQRRGIAIICCAAGRSRLTPVRPDTGCRDVAEMHRGRMGKRDHEER